MVVSCHVDRDVPLHTRTSLRVGGVAKLLATPATSRQVEQLLANASSDETTWTCLGAGTNVLFADDGFSGLVISTSALRGLSIDGTKILAAAGEPLAAVARAACNAGLSGLEWACGIPGTIGGAVSMNAGAHGGEIADVLAVVESASSRGSVRRPASELGLGYRSSAIQSGMLREVIAEATFRMVRSTPGRALAEAERLLEVRRDTQPSGVSAGCVFRNPLDGPSAGELLDRSGCKSLRVGHACVSPVHANFIINEGQENAADVLALIAEMKRRVREAFGVDLIEEIVLL